MKKRSIISILSILFLWNCSSVKKLEVTAPFTIGETFAQNWVIEEEPEKKGYEVIIPIVSLNNDEAALKNLYHKGKMRPLQIELTEMGNVAIAEFGLDSVEKDIADKAGTEEDDEPFPFVLSETQAVISYVNNEKVKYYKINGIHRNLPVSYPTVRAKKER